MAIFLSLVFVLGLIISVVLLLIGLVLKIVKRPSNRILKGSGISFGVAILSFMIIMVGIEVGSGNSSTNAELDPEDTFEGTLEETETNTQEIEQASSNESESEEEQDRGTRINPVPFGKSTMKIVDINDPEQNTGFLRLTLSNLISGEEAYNFLLSENQFNEQAPEGYQWIIFDVTAELVDGSENEPYVSYPQVSTVSESGSESPEGHYAVINDEFGNTDLYNGGTTTGKIATIAPIDEEYTIKWIENFREPVFFDNK